MEVKTSFIWKENWPEPCGWHTKDVCCVKCHPRMWHAKLEEIVIYLNEVLNLNEPV